MELVFFLLLLASSYFYVMIIFVLDKYLLNVVYTSDINFATYTWYRTVIQDFLFELYLTIVKIIGEISVKPLKGYQ